MYSDEEAIEEIEKLIKKYDTSDPYKLVEECDYSIVYAELGTKTWGQMVRSNRCCTIFININLPEHIKKFVIAHELGHCRLHRGHSTPFYRNVCNTSISKKERQANVFAINLLKSEIDSCDSLTNFEVLDYLGLSYEFESYVK